MNYIKSFSKQIYQGTQYPPEVYPSTLVGPVLLIQVLMKPKARVLVVTTQAIYVYDLLTASLVRSTKPGLFGDISFVQFEHNTDYGSLLAIIAKPTLFVLEPWSLGTLNEYMATESTISTLAVGPSQFGIGYTDGQAKLQHYIKSDSEFKLWSVLGKTGVSALVILPSKLACVAHS